jgi:hypothetical protein
VLRAQAVAVCCLRMLMLRGVVRVAASMKGPGSSVMRSIARHWFMKISSYAQVVFASALDSATMRAPFAWTALISVVRSWMRLSRVRR